MEQLPGCVRVDGKQANSYKSISAEVTQDFVVQQDSDRTAGTTFLLYSSEYLKKIMAFSAETWFAQQDDWLEKLPRLLIAILTVAGTDALILTFILLKVVKSNPKALPPPPKGNHPGS